MIGLVISCVGTAFCNGLLKERWEGRIQVAGRRGRRRKQLVYGLKKKRGYWKFKEEVLDRSLGKHGCIVRLRE